MWVLLKGAADLVGGGKKGAADLVGGGKKVQRYGNQRVKARVEGLGTLIAINLLSVLLFSVEMFNVVGFTEGYMKGYGA